MMKTALYIGMLVAGLSLAVGCTDGEGESEGQEASHEGKKYEQVKGEGNVYKEVSACELFSRPGPVGVFTVDAITGSYSAETGPQIHVQLNEETLWEETLPNPFTFSFRGGEDDADVMLGAALSATVGERVVLLVHEAGLTVDTELQIFREIAPGQFSNGQLFRETGLSLVELKDAVQQVRENTVCPLSADFGFDRVVDQGGGDIEEGEAVIGNPED